MPKSNLIRDVEEIANRISRKNIKESRAIIQLGTWVKTLVDELKAVKQRLDEIDIRVKKINAYGATALTPAEAEGEKQAAAAPVVRVKPGELKHYRLTRRLSQAAMGALLGVTPQKYARWEFGKSVMIAPIEEKFRDSRGPSCAQNCKSSVSFRQMGRRPDSSVGRQRKHRPRPPLPPRKRNRPRR